MCVLLSGRLSYREICWVIISACWTRRVRWPSTTKSRDTVPTTCRPSRLHSAVVTGRHCGISTELLLLIVRYRRLLTTGASSLLVVDVMLLALDFRTFLCLAMDDILASESIVSFSGCPMWARGISPLSLHLPTFPPSTLCFRMFYFCLFLFLTCFVYFFAFPSLPILQE